MTVKLQIENYGKNPVAIRSKAFPNGRILTRPASGDSSGFTLELPDMQTAKAVMSDINNSPANIRCFIVDSANSDNSTPDTTDNKNPDKNQGKAFKKKQPLQSQKTEEGSENKE